MKTSNKEVKRWFDWGKKQKKFCEMHITRDIFFGYEYPFYLKTSTDRTRAEVDYEYNPNVVAVFLL